LDQRLAAVDALGLMQKPLFVMQDKGWRDRKRRAAPLFCAQQNANGRFLCPRMNGQERQRAGAA
jgi:hypothetical protein